MQLLLKLISSKKLIFNILFILIILSLFPKENVYADNIINEQLLEVEGLHPNDFTHTSDGYFWFITNARSYVTKTDLNGRIEHYLIHNTPSRITNGFQNDIWFTAYVGNKLGRIDNEGKLTEYDLLSNGYPLGITKGPDGNIWFTEYIGNRVGKIKPDGEIIEYRVSYGPHGITTGPDGNIWYTLFDMSMIGRITPDGNVNEFMLPTSRSNPENIISGSDGNLWFTEAKANKIGKISITGEVTEYSIPTPDSHPFDLTLGKDGNIWFTELNGNNIGRITPNGIIDEFPIPTSQTNPFSIIGGFDNNIWFVEANANKLGSIDVTKAPPPTVKPTSTPMPTPQVLLTDYKQTDPRWGGDRLQNSSECGTMYGFGCAVTSVADVFNAYGKMVFEDTNPLNPGTLNNWLSSNKGFIACNIVWATASRAIQIGAPLISFRNASIDWLTGQQLIDTALASGNLPIIGISRPTGSHYLLVSEKLPDIDGKPNYKIIDPALYPFVPESLGNTGKSLSEIYGGFDKVFQTIIYNRESNPQKTLTARAHSPVQLLITDPNGVQTGYDLSEQNIKENIPDSVYGIEPGVGPINGESSSYDETKYFQQTNPLDGDYIIQVIGTGNGKYTLDFTLNDENGNEVVQVIKGYAQKDVTEVYIIHNVPGDQTPFEVKKEVTFSVLKSDLKKLYLQKQIKSKIIYQLLLTQAEFAEKASLLSKQPLGTKLSVMALKAMQFELVKVRNTTLTEDAFAIINTDLQILIKNAIGDSGGSSGGGS